MTDTKNDKAALYASSLIEVSPHIGRLKLSLSLPKEISERRRLGRKRGISQNETKFVSNNCSSTVLQVIPDEEKELRSIESKARHACYKSAIVQNYVLADSLSEVSKLVEEFKKQYFEKRDEILAVWDPRMSEFSENLEEYLKNCGLGKRQTAKWHKALMDQLPSRDIWYNSFRFWLEIRDFPIAPGHFPGMEEAFEARTDALSSAILSKHCENLFEKTAGVLTCIADGEGNLRKRVTALISEAGQILNTRALQDDEIIDLAEKITQINPDQQDEDTLAGEIECRCADIMRLADANHVFLNCGLLPDTVTKEYLYSVSDEQLQFA